MNYRLLFDLEVFKSPVVIVFEHNETRYSDGMAAKLNAVFPKPVIVSSITAKDDTIVITVVENTAHNNADWAENDGEVGFF